MPVLLYARFSILVSNLRVDSIWQDEPTDTIGDGNTLIDGYGDGGPLYKSTGQ